MKLRTLHEANGTTRACVRDSLDLYSSCTAVMEGQAMCGKSSPHYDFQVGAEVDGLLEQRSWMSLEWRRYIREYNLHDGAIKIASSVDTTWAPAVREARHVHGG